MIRISVFVAYLILVSCKPQANNIDYEAYSAILDAFLQDNGVGDCVVIIREAEDRKEIFDEIITNHKIKGVPQLTQGLGTTKLVFDNKFSLKSIVTYTISESEFDSLTVDTNGDLDWKPFHDKYPGAIGLIEMSKLFLSDDRTKGGLYISIGTDSLSGTGYYVLFDLKSKHIIVEKYLIWTG